MPIYFTSCKRLKTLDLSFSFIQPIVVASLHIAYEEMHILPISMSSIAQYIAQNFFGMKSHLSVTFCVNYFVLK